jgi:acetoin:2,6-dichlorophenolindophenol oxidoreductase subunit beta
MGTMTVEEAMTEAMTEEMRRDTRVITFGEGVATKKPSLRQEFGDKRVRNTPLSEGIIAGTAVGAAATGLRPVVDLLFAPFLTLAMDGIVNSAGKLRYMSGGQFSFPLVVIAETGGGWGAGAQHNHNIEAWFAHSPGLKVVMPSNPSDFKGLLKSAIRDENPVIFFVDIGLLSTQDEVPDADHVVPLGNSFVCREGNDITLISYAKSVQACMAAAGSLQDAGVSAEVLDLRTLKPLDETGILESVRKTGRAVVVHEATGVCGIGAEVAAIIAEKAFASLKSPVFRLTGPDAPSPSSFPLEQAFAPDAKRIAATVSHLLGR